MMRFPCTRRPLSGGGKLVSSRFSVRRFSPSAASSMQVEVVPCLEDNYGFLLHAQETGHTAAVDTPCAKSLVSELKRKGWTLTHILNTHHHWDHTVSTLFRSDLACPGRIDFYSYIEVQGGNEELCGHFQGVTVAGPAKEQIPCVSRALLPGDTLRFGNETANILDVSGHTSGHIAYYFSHSGLLFPGDSIFPLGCGRVFEGTFEDSYAALTSIMSLPDETLIYSAHEYARSNARFAMTVDHSNAKLRARCEEIEALRAAGRPSVPSTVKDERETNPFVRLPLLGAKDQAVEIFKQLRQAKDSF